MLFWAIGAPEANLVVEYWYHSPETRNRLFRNECTQADIDVLEALNGQWDGRWCILHFLNIYSSSPGS
jgi:hypothetical protein